MNARMLRDCDKFVFYFKAGNVLQFSCTSVKKFKILFIIFVGCKNMNSTYCRTEVKKYQMSDKIIDYLHDTHI